MRNYQDANRREERVKDFLLEKIREKLNGIDRNLDKEGKNATSVRLLRHACELTEVCESLKALAQLFDLISDSSSEPTEKQPD